MAREKHPSYKAMIRYKPPKKDDKKKDSKKKKDRLKKDGTTPVYIQYVYDQKAIYFHTGISVPPKYFTGEQNKAIKKEHPHSRYYNEVINSKISRIQTILKRIDFEKITNPDTEPTVDKVRDEYKKEIPNQVKEKDILTLYKQYVENVSAEMESGSIKQKNVTYKHLGAFLKNYDRREIEGVDLKFYNDFKRFLFEKKGLSNSSVGNHIKNLKAFLYYLKLNDIADVKVELRNFKKPVADDNKIVYTRSEIKEILKADLTDNPKLDRVRDLVVFSCFTGLRISDIQRFGKHHIKDGCIDMKAYKTGSDIFQPLRPEALKILQKYDYDLPVISDQKLNDYIKELGILLEFNTPTEKKITKGEKQFKTFLKHELLSTHTGVKTFITHSLEDGFPVEHVAYMTGKSIDVIYKHYYKKDKNTLKIKAKELWKI